MGLALPLLFFVLRDLLDFHFLVHLISLPDSLVLALPMLARQFLQKLGLLLDAGIGTDGKFGGAIICTGGINLEIVLQFFTKLVNFVTLSLNHGFDVMA
jgi:hypothetical protein